MIVAVSINYSFWISVIWSIIKTICSKDTITKMKEIIDSQVTCSHFLFSSPATGKYIDKSDHLYSSFKSTGEKPSGEGYAARSDFCVCGMASIRWQPPSTSPSPAADHSTFQWLTANYLWLCSQLYNGEM